MTKKHFIALADSVRDLISTYDARTEQPIYDESQRRRIVGDMADFCRSQNGRFNRERWIGYINGECGPNGGKAK